MDKKERNVKQSVFHLVQGMLIGLGGVLPGISGGVLCVVFGIYKPIMEVLADPLHMVRKHFKLLLPVAVGLGLGVVGISRLLGFFLTRYEDPSICLFVGLIVGMLPSLFREAGEKGRSRGSYVAMAAAFIVLLAILTSLKIISVEIEPNFMWYVFCGFCLALSVIAPGMSFSTLLMPLGLYTPFVEGIGNFDFAILIPGGIGGLLTVILLVRAISSLLENHYSVVFHGILGIVIAATLVIVPWDGFLLGSWTFMGNIVCLVVGVIAALLLDGFNSRVETE